MMPSKTLVIETPGIEPLELPWDELTRAQIPLDRFEISDLERGDIVWKGEAAYQLEVPDAE